MTPPDADARALSAGDERESVSLSRAAREEDSFGRSGEVKSEEGSVLSVAVVQCFAVRCVLSLLLPRKGENCFAQKQNFIFPPSLVAVLVLNPSPPPSLPPSPPPFAYTFSETGGEERVCSVLLCGVRDAALRRGGGKRVEVVDDSLAKFIASLGPVCRRKKRSGAKEAAENVTSGYEDFFVNPGKKRVED